MTTPPPAITDDVLVFPNNVQQALVDTMTAVLPAGIAFFKRSLRASDPNESIGIFPVNWVPEDDSVEMRGSGLGTEPTISRYILMVQGYVKDADEQRGLARHSVMSKLIRSMLYRSPTLAVSLRALSVPLFDSVETLSRYGVRTQRYISNDVSGSWLYLSNTEFWFETTTI